MRKNETSSEDENREENEHAGVNDVHASCSVLRVSSTVEKNRKDTQQKAGSEPGRDHKQNKNKKKEKQRKEEKNNDTNKKQQPKKEGETCK